MMMHDHDHGHAVAHAHAHAHAEDGEETEAGDEDEDEDEDKDAPWCQILVEVIQIFSDVGVPDGDGADDHDNGDDSRPTARGGGARFWSTSKQISQTFIVFDFVGGVDLVPMLWQQLVSSKMSQNAHDEVDDGDVMLMMMMHLMIMLLL